MKCFDPYTDLKNTITVHGIAKPYGFRTKTSPFSIYGTVIGIGIGYTIRPLAINKSPHGIDGYQTKASP
jgi:hypothetical protein